MIRLIADSGVRLGRATKLRKESALLFRALRGAGIVELEPVDARTGRKVVVASDLQKEFSIFHTLSLYLLDALEELDPDSEDYPLDVVTLVESILENPGVVLQRQEAQAKTEKMEAMKAAGMEYEARMEELDRVSYPKPLADFIYNGFNRFVGKHPWVGRESIRPKSIARDMFEKYVSFNEYIKTYGLQRAEGVLLRYLHQVYKTLEQTVPDVFKTDPVVELSAWLRATIERVDSSLVQEWENMLHPPEDLEGDFSAPDDIEIDISKDKRSFYARIRVEMHRLVSTLSKAAYDEAESSVCDSVDAEGEPWTAKRFEDAMADYHAEHERLIFNHQARMNDKTQIQAVSGEDYLWRVRQVLLDPEESGMWMIDAQVDLRENKNPEGPLLRVQRIGV